MEDIKTLKRMRLEVVDQQDPDEVLCISRPLITSGRVLSAGDEQWDIYEQTIVAALEVSDDALASECLTRLSDKFPASARVHALKGMVLEATRNPQEAFSFYDKVLSVEPTNIVSLDHITKTKPD